ncbi:MAG: 50S ribosomal protein L11 methyltransferase [Firmicutes bacterium]|nr:50S ribosomal protein L11 methyltransferase [Bacillota bacterium]
MEYLQIIIQAPAWLEDELTGLLFLWGAQGVAVDDPSIIAAHLEAGDWDASVFDGQTIATGRVTLSTMAENNAAGREMCRQIREYCRMHEETACEIRKQPAMDWQQKWKESFRPLPVGRRLEILPYWLSGREEAGRIPIWINPGPAFGTGEHATTAMVLELLEECLQPGQRIGDIGCGSGILAVAALRLGASYAAAVDIDPACRKSVAEHLRLNGLAQDAIELWITDILQDDGARLALKKRELQLCTANLTAGLLMALGPMLDGFLPAGALFLCSGIIDRRKEEVRACLENNGLKVLQGKNRDGWQAYLCRKEG